MYSGIPKYLHATALTVAGIAHAGLLSWATQVQDAVLFPQTQVIQVSMVAPTKIKEIKTELPSEVQTKSLPKPKKKSIEKHKDKKQKRLPPKNKTHVLTSGLIAKDATKKISAATKPVAANYLNNSPPPYPEKARLRRQQGTVLLDVCVKENGKPRHVRIIKSSGHRLLDQAALKTVRLWSFVPARQGGVAIEAHVEVPVTFEIKQKKRT